MRTTSEKARRGEMRVYERLGIKRFKRLVLSLEKRRHQKDGGRNVNYHIERFSLRGLYAFCGYLLYHAVVHTVGILVAALCCMLPLFFPHTAVFAVLGGVCILGNVYCLLLQRYTYLKLAMQIQKREKKQRQKTARWVQAIRQGLDGKDPAMRREEFALLSAVHARVSAGGTYILTADTAAILYRLAALLQADAKNAPCTQTGTQTLYDVLAALPQKKQVLPFAKRCTAHLQRLFGISQAYTVLFTVNVLPDNAQVARAYRALLACDADEWTVWHTLFVTYQSVLEGTNG